VDLAGVAVELVAGIAGIVELVAGIVELVAGIVVRELGEPVELDLHPAGAQLLVTQPVRLAVDVELDAVLVGAPYPTDDGTAGHRDLDQTPDIASPVPRQRQRAVHAW